MSPYLIDLHDTGVRIFQGEKLIRTSPGYALISPTGIETGSSAFARARLNPGQVNRQFWQRLSTDSLPQSSSFARHYADLAYLHLQHLGQYLEMPAQVVFSVPASYSTEQLSLLTGIAQACTFQLVGLVDAAVAAAAVSEQNAGTVVVVDMQLHQTDISLLSVTANNSGKTLQRQSVETVNLGLIQIQDKWQQLIADAFIDQCRFDPQHNAVTEQELMLKLPGWLAAIKASQEVSLDLDASGPRVQARLQTAQAIKQLLPLYQKLQIALERVCSGTDSCSLLVSKQIDDLPGMEESLPAHQVIPANAIAIACHRYLDIICTGVESRQDGSADQALAFVTALPLNNQGQAGQNETTSLHTGASGQQVLKAKQVNRATHILWGALAYPITRPLFIGKRIDSNNANNNGHETSKAESSSQSDVGLDYNAYGFSSVYCSINQNDNGMDLRVLNGALVKVNGKAVSGTRTLDLADKITLVTPELTLTVIGEVTDGSPT